jgi:hypothetical protein
MTIVRTLCWKPANIFLGSKPSDLGKIDNRRKEGAMQKFSLPTSERLENALAGKVVRTPVYSVYDAFLTVSNIDWAGLCDDGLGIIQHVDVISSKYPDLEITETIEEDDKHIKRDVYWNCSKGVLHEYYLQDKNNPLLPWKMEYLIKNEQDYKLMAYALRDAEFSLSEERPLFPVPENLAITSDALYKMISLDRTPFQAIQIDYAGLERFSVDLAFSNKLLLDLIELMNEQLLQKVSLISEFSKIRDIKLWENMSIEVMGPHSFRDNLVPVYKKVGDILRKSSKRLHVHYDGKIAMIAEDLAELDIFGLDSFTSSPEGDMTVKEARDIWPDKFLWIHPSLSLFEEDIEKVKVFIQEAVENSGDTLYSFLISEDVPPHAIKGIPKVLEFLNGF